MNPDLKPVLSPSLLVPGSNLNRSLADTTVAPRVPSLPPELALAPCT